MKTVVSLRKVSSHEKYAVLIIKTLCQSYTILFSKGRPDKKPSCLLQKGAMDILSDETFNINDHPRLALLHKPPFK